MKDAMLEALEEIENGMCHIKGIGPSVTITLSQESRVFTYTSTCDIL